MPGCRLHVLNERGPALMPRLPRARCACGLLPIDTPLLRQPLGLRAAEPVLRTYLQDTAFLAA